MKNGVITLKINIKEIIRKKLLKNRQSSIYRLFFSYIIVVFVLVIMMFLVIYKFEHNLLNNWLVKNSISTINNTKERIDETIFKDKIDYITKKILQDIFNIPELSGYLVSDYSQPYYDYKTEKYIQQYLQSMSTSIASKTTFINNIGIFYKAKNQMVSLLGSFQPTHQDMLDIFGCEELDTSYTYPFLWSHLTKYCKLTNIYLSSDNSYINIIRKIPDTTFPNTHGGSIIVSVSENSLYKEFEAIIDSDTNTMVTSDTNFLIIDRNGTIISAKDKNLIYKNIDIFGIKLESDNIPDYLIKSVNNKDFIFTFKPSTVTTFIYLSYTPMSTITSSFSLIFKLLLIVTLVTLLIGLIFSVYSTYSIFTPLLNIKNACMEKLKGYSLNTSGSLNEYALINSAIDIMSDKLDYHEKTLKEVMPIIGQHILDMLLLKDGNINNIMQEFNITDTKFMRPFYIIIVIRPVYEHKVLNENMYTGYIGSEILTGAEAAFANTDSDFIAGNIDKDIILLINCYDVNKIVEDSLMYISKYFSDFSGLNIFVGISNVEKNIESASSMYEQAITCLNYSFLYPEDKIFNYKDVCKWEQTYPENIEKLVDKVNITIAQGIWNNYNNMIDMLVQEIKSDRYCYSHIIKLLGSIQQAIGSTAVKFNIELNNDALISEKLPENLNTLTDFAELLKHMGNHISNIIKNRNENRNLQLVDKIKTYINANITNNNITLNNIAELMSISPAHLSRVFKDITGMNFIDYLVFSKLEYARYLLLNTSDKILDISKTIGYSNVHYFINKFKAHYGTTPNNYRIEQKQANIIN